MTRAISNMDDVIDSRDVIARLEELRDERADLQTAADEAREEFKEHTARDYAELTAEEIEADAKLVALESQILDKDAALKEWDSDNGEELTALEKFAEEASGYAADWQHGEALIRDSYFEDYARQLAEDIGAINSDASWPNNCIDWERAARELRMDYSAVDFDGTTYWTR